MIVQIVENTTKKYVTYPKTTKVYPVGIFDVLFKLAT